MRVTMKQIAERCGVSKGLVSRIVNGDPSLRCTDEVRKRVLDEVERQGFVPDHNARALSMRTLQEDRPLRLGYITYTSPGIKGHPYFDKIIDGVIAEIKETHCELAAGMDTQEAHRRFIEKLPLANHKLDGLILFGNFYGDDICTYFRQQAEHILTICNIGSDPDWDFVGSDPDETMGIMLRHVRQCGYEDIGMLVGDDFLRMEHAIESARANGLRITDFFLNGKYGSQPAYDAVKERLKTTRPPAVICCLNDEMAIGCIRALRDCGYRVPEDVSVTGHDDILRANYSEVPLTTVRIYKEEMGKLAVTILRERIRNKRKFSIRVIIPGKLIQRESLIPRKKEIPET